jgi:hypothetical protein
MVTRTLLLGVLATVSILVLFFPEPAACQEAQGTSGRDESTRFDYSKTPKKQAVNEVLGRVRALADTRSEKVTPEIEKIIRKGAAARWTM